MKYKKILLVLGGMYHDFEGFNHYLQNLMKPRGFTIEPTYNFDQLLSLPNNFDLLVSATSLSIHRPGQNDTGPELFSDTQVEALTAWVRDGGNLLGIHSATVIGKSNQQMVNLLGGRFIEHPPQFTFTVYPLSRSHPIIEGVEAFSVQDEFYKQEITQDSQIHLVAMDRGVVFPMAWTRNEGKGKVAVLSPGHHKLVWEQSMYQKLVVQSINWLSDQD
jgi:type 1 glutamine amidotransferase